MGWLWLVVAGCLLAYIIYAAVGCIRPFKNPVPMDPNTRVQLNSVKFTSDVDAPGGDYAHIAESGEESFARRVELVRAAQLTLDMTIYTIKPGFTGEAFFAEVLRAADRGVRVRILLSGKTNKLRQHRMVYKALRGHRGVTLREFNPPNLFLPQYWNVMMHDKFIIADGKALSLGGRNFGDEYCVPPGYNGRVTHDREVFVLGAKPHSVVRRVLEYFEQLWDHPATQPITRARDKGEKNKTALLDKALEFEEENPTFYRSSLPLGEMVVPTRKATLVHNPLTLERKQPWVGWQMFRLAKLGRSVWIQTPYMTDANDILYQFERLTFTGELNILTNSCKSSPNLPAFSVYLKNRAKFLAAGANLFEYAPRDKSSIHGKSMLVDDRLCAIGSFNLDDRSMYIDTETMLVFDSPQLTNALRTRMNVLIEQSAQVQPDNTYRQEDADKLAGGGKRALFRIGAALFRPIRFLV